MLGKKKIVVEYAKRGRGRPGKKGKDWDDGLTQSQKENYDKAVLVYNKAKYEFYHSESLKVHNGWRVPELFVKLKDIRFNGCILRKYGISYINNDIYVSNKDDSSVETESISVVVKTEVISPDEEYEPVKYQKKNKSKVVTPRRTTKRVSISSGVSDEGSEPPVKMENEEDDDEEDEEWEGEYRRRVCGFRRSSTTGPKSKKKGSKEAEKLKGPKSTKKSIKKTKKVYVPKKTYIKKKDRVKNYNDNHAKLNMMNASASFTMDVNNLMHCAECDSSVDISHFTFVDALILYILFLLFNYNIT